jgi:hypothetical protein
MEKIFLDCGILKNVIKISQPARSQAFYNSLYNSNIIQDRTPFFIYSPLLMLEIVGVRFIELIPPQRLMDEFAILKNEKDYSNISLLLVDFLARLRFIFKNENIISKASLKLKIKHEIKFRDVWGRRVLVNIFLNGISVRNVKDLHQAFILEMIQAINYETLLEDENLSTYELHQIMTYVRAHIERQMNLPFLRLISNIFHRLEPSNENLLREFEETGDCEIVHFAVLGHSSEGIFSPVKVFTTENINSWKDRIKLVIGFIKFINETLVPDYNRLNPETPLPEVSVNPGFIYKVNPATGIIETDYLDVRVYIDSLLAEVQ